MNKARIAALVGIGVGVMGGLWALNVSAEDASDASSGLARLSEMMDETEIGLADAVKIAVEETGGTAIEAEFEAEEGELLFEVAVLADGEVLEVVVDAVSGDVIEVEHEDDEYGSMDDDDAEGEDDDEAGDDGEGDEEDDDY